MIIKTSSRDNKNFVVGEAEIKAMEPFRVLVGIPSNRIGRTGDPKTPNNAALGYLHEFGDPSTNLPPRPFLIPGVEAINSKIKSVFSNAITLALHGKKGAMKRAFDVLGLLAVSSVKGIITDGIPPPITMRAKYARLERAGNFPGVSKARRAKLTKQYLAGDFTPLIDTAQMLNSITYVVRKK